MEYPINLCVWLFSRPTKASERPEGKGPRLVEATKPLSGNILCLFLASSALSRIKFEGGSVATGILYTRSGTRMPMVGFWGKRVDGTYCELVLDVLVYLYEPGEPSGGFIFVYRGWSFVFSIATFMFVRPSGPPCQKLNGPSPTLDPF